MRRFFLLLFTSAVLTWCSQIAADEASSRYLEGKIMLDDKEYNLIHGYYTYKDKEVEINKLDPFSPMEAAGQFDNLAVAKNSEIEIVLEDKAFNITVHQWNENGLIEEIQLNKNILTVPAEEGYYKYEIVGKWKNGETTLVFDIDVK